MIDIHWGSIGFNHSTDFPTWW